MLRSLLFTLLVDSTLVENQNMSKNNINENSVLYQNIAVYRFQSDEFPTKIVLRKRATLECFIFIIVCYEIFSEPMTFKSYGVV